MTLKSLLFVSIFSLGACASLETPDPCFNNQGQQTGVHQCHINSLQNPVPHKMEEDADIENMKDKLGLRFRRHSCQPLGTERVHLKMYCTNIYSIQVEINCLQRVAGRKIPTAIRGKSFKWKIGKQLGTHTTNEKGRFVISIDNRLNPNIEKESLYITPDTGKTQTLTPDQYSRPINLKPEDC